MDALISAKLSSHPHVQREDEEDGACHCGEAAIESKEREVPDSGNSNCQRLILHHNNGVSLRQAHLAIALRAEDSGADR